MSHNCECDPDGDANVIECLDCGEGFYDRWGCMSTCKSCRTKRDKAKAAGVPYVPALLTEQGDVW